MNFQDFIKNHTEKTRHNYIVPGLMSHRLGLHMVRVFENTRKQEFFITPHNHRFPLMCTVLRGHVVNTLYTAVNVPEKLPAHIRQSFDTYGVFNYDHREGGINSPCLKKAPFARKSELHRTGATYVMAAEEFHSISFSEDAVVLFLEGENSPGKSQVLLPVGSEGAYCNTAVTLPWMFRE